MYAIYGNMDPINIYIYTIHGSYGIFMLNYRVNLSKAFEHHSCSSTPNSRILWSGVHPRGPSDPSGRTGHKQVVFRWPQETYGQTGEAQQGSDSFMASMDWFKGNIFSGKLWFVPHRVQKCTFSNHPTGKTCDFMTDGFHHMSPVQVLLEVAENSITVCSRQLQQWLLESTAWHEF